MVKTADISTPTWKQSNLLPSDLRIKKVKQLHPPITHEMSDTDTGAGTPPLSTLPLWKVSLSLLAQMDDWLFGVTSISLAPSPSIPRQKAFLFPTGLALTTSYLTGGLIAHAAHTCKSLYYIYIRGLYTSIPLAYTLYKLRSSVSQKLHGVFQSKLGF